VSKKIAELNGWTVSEIEPSVLEATKDGQRSIRCGGGEGTDQSVLRARIFEAIDEVEAGGSSAPDMPAAKAGATVHAAQIVVHDDQE
jgi:hypothetical protein